MERFVFLDDLNRPYRVQDWGDEIWMFYWLHGKWISLRVITLAEANMFRYRALEERLARLYDKGVA